MDPLLGEERRRRLGISALTRRDPALEERYLFHACVARPTERLWLSWRSSDEEGRPAARSPFVDDVLDLLAPDAEEAEARLKQVHGLDRVVFAPEEAPSRRRTRSGAGGGRPALRPGPARTAHEHPGTGRAGRAQSRGRRHDREVDRVPLSLVRRPRAEAAAARPPAGGAHGRVDRPRGAGAPVPRSAGRRSHPAPWRSGPVAGAGGSSSSPRRPRGMASRPTGLWPASHSRGCERRSTGSSSARAAARRLCAPS